MIDTIITTETATRDFIDDWLYEPEDLENFVGDKIFDTPEELGKYLKEQALKMIECETDTYPSVGPFGSGRVVFNALYLAMRTVDLVDADILGRAIWDDYRAMEGML